MTLVIARNVLLAMLIAYLGIHSRPASASVSFLEGMETLKIGISFNSFIEIKIQGRALTNNFLIVQYVSRVDSLALLLGKQGFKHNLGTVEYFVGCVENNRFHTCCLSTNNKRKVHSISICHVL